MDIEGEKRVKTQFVQQGSWRRIAEGNRRVHLLLQCHSRQPQYTQKYVTFHETFLRSSRKDLFIFAEPFIPSASRPFKDTTHKMRTPNA